MNRLFLLFFLLCLTKICYAQYLEEWIESSENPGELKIWFEDLEANKLDLRGANVIELASLPFFDDNSAEQLISFLNNSRKNTDLTDLSQVEFLSGPQKEAINRFCVYTFEDFGNTRSKIKFGAIRQRNSDSSYRWQGLAISDFKRSDKVSGYLYAKGTQNNIDLLQNYYVGIDVPQKKFRPRILLGDYQFESATGLIFSRGYGQANWLTSNETLLPSKSKGLYSKPTSSGLSMYRGVAAELHKNGALFSFLYSSRLLDGELAVNGVEEITENQAVSEESNNAQNNRLREDLFGVSMNAQTGFSEVGIQAYRSNFTPKLVPDLTQENSNGLYGNKLNAGSIYINGGLKNYFLKSELAVTDPGGYAYQGSVSHLNSLLSWTLFKTMSSADFYSPHAKLWGDFEFESNNSAKTGLKLQKVWKNYSLTISGINENKPYSTPNSPLSKSSSKIQANIKSVLSDKCQVSLLVNRTYNEETSSSAPSQKYYTDRAKFDIWFFGKEEHRARFEIKSSKEPASSQHYLGTLLFFQSKFSVTGFDCFLRISHFNSEDRSVNLYMYENTIYGDYPLIQFGGSGSRSSFIISRKINVFRVTLKIADTVVKSDDNFLHNGELAFEVNFRR